VADFEKIFKFFIREENINLIRGTGLGLSVVKESIDLMKGEIMVLNTLGNGTRFIVKLPKTEAF
jgi:signal transduction histidine kinase